MELDIVIILSAFLILSLLAGLYTYFSLSSGLRIEQARTTSLDSALENLGDELGKTSALLQEKETQLEEMKSALAVQKFKEENLTEKINELLADEDKWAKQFELLANRVLHKQSAHFIEKQTSGMANILDPLKEKIKLFEEKVEKSNRDSIERHSTLKEQIRNLSQKSEQVSHDANNLAKALKGDYKKQGHWGELILESILEKSGLERDREYFTQLTERDDEGKMQRPDVVITLPGKKILIVDSKVSLSAYSELVNADTEEQAIAARKAHSLAIRKHIEGLSEKRYHDIYKVESPDFVLMFIPIDTAFSAALDHDPELYNYAFDKNIVIVTASTLLATLKTVETMWRNDKQNRYALTIADEAGKMFDKFAGFLQDMNKMGNQLTTVQNTYSDSMRKLYNGTGSLVNRAEKLKELGAKASKSLPATVFDVEE